MTRSHSKFQYCTLKYKDIRTLQAIYQQKIKKLKNMENIQFREKTCYSRWSQIKKQGHIQNFSIVALNTGTLIAKYVTF